jgi:predicted Zn-dependent protease
VIYYLANHSYIFVPTEWDIKLGESTKSIMESEFTVCKDKKAENILSKSLQSLVPKDSKFKYEVKILSDSTPNAFAISGGKIYVLSGIFNQAKNSNELAGVLAHEIGHVERRHHIRNLTKAVSTAFLVSIIVGPGLELGSTLLFLSYSRQFEEESDSYGVALLANNGYHPRGMSAFFRSMIDYEKSLTSGTILEESESKEEDEESTSLTANNLLNFLSTHPPTEERIQAIQKLIRENNYKGNRKFISDQDWTYLQKSCSAL